MSYNIVLRDEITCLVTRFGVIECYFGVIKGSLTTLVPKGGHSNGRKTLIRIYLFLKVEGSVHSTSSPILFKKY